MSIKVKCIDPKSGTLLRMGAIYNAIYETPAQDGRPRCRIKEIDDCHNSFYVSRFLLLPTSINKNITIL